MKITSLSLTMGETINMGNFNNVRYEVSGTIDIAGQTEEQAAESVEKFRQWLRVQAQTQRKAIKGDANAV